jgi:hypothetical protein
MKVLDVEGVANHDGPESCAGVGNCVGEALAGGGVGPVMSRERHESLRGAEAVEDVRRPHPAAQYCERLRDPARSETRCMRPSTSCGNREIPRSTRADGARVRKWEPRREDRR